MKSKLYTRAGDAGHTHLCSGERVSKDSIHVKLVGEIDELNSYIGLLRTRETRPREEDVFRHIQNDLFIIGSLCSSHLKESAFTGDIKMEHVEFLENEIDFLDADTPKLTEFVLPGGTEQNAFAHIARTVCRRLECSMYEKGALINNSFIYAYINRLSDFLFAYARYVCYNDDLKRKEFVWEKE